MGENHKQNPYLSLQELIAQGKQAAPEFEEIVNQIFSDLRENNPDHFQDAVFKTGLKSEDRIIKKVNGDYQEDHARITDIVRGRIVVGTAEEIQIVRDYARSMPDTYKITSINDRFAVPSGTGYRDVNMTLRLSNGHVAEFRFEQKDMVEFGELSHYIYEQSQKIERAAQEEAAKSGASEVSLTPEQAKELRLNEIVNNYLHGVAADIVDQDLFLDERGQQKVFEANLAGAKYEVGAVHSASDIKALIEEAREAVRKKEEGQSLNRQNEQEVLDQEPRPTTNGPPNGGNGNQAAIITLESRMETLAQQATESRVEADQKALELEKAQELADEKAKIAESTATTATAEIDALKHSIALSTDEMEGLPANLIAVNEKICAGHQAEIDQLNSEISRTANEAQEAKQTADAAQQEQQEAATKALLIEEALKVVEAQHQEEVQKALEAQQAQEEAKAAEEAVQEKEEAAQQAKEEAQQKAEEARIAEEIAQQKETEAQEAEQIAQQKATEAEKAEEIALQKEEEALKAEEAAKQVNSEKQESQEAQEAEDNVKEKVIEAEQARTEANQKAEESKQAEEVAEQKAEESQNARNDADQKAEEAKQAEEIAQQKAVEAEQANAALTEDSTAKNLQTEEKAAAQEIAGTQEEQTNDKPQQIETASVITTDEVESAKTTQETAQAQTTSPTQEEEKQELVVPEEKLEDNQVLGNSTNAVQTEDATQVETSDELKGETAEQSTNKDNVVSIDATEIQASPTVQDNAQTHDFPKDASTQGEQEEQTTGVTNIEAAVEAIPAQAQPPAQVANSDVVETDSQDNPPITTDKKEVSEAVEGDIDENVASSEGRSEGNPSDQEEEKTIEQAAQQTVVDSEQAAMVAEHEMEEEEEKEIEDYTIAASEVTGMGVGNGSGGGGMCFASCIDPIFAEWASEAQSTTEYLSPRRSVHGLGFMLYTQPVIS